MKSEKQNINIRKKQNYLLATNKTTFSKNLGQRIVEIRKEKGWSQAELSRRCYKDRQAIERIENGKVNPNIYTLYQLATAMEVDLHLVLNFKFIIAIPPK